MILKHHYAIASILTTVFTLTLSIFIYFSGKEKKLGRLYALWALCVGFWSLFLVLSIYAPTQEIALLWCKLLHVWAIALPAVYVHFALEYINIYESRKKLVRFLYLLALVLLAFDFSPWFITATFRPKFDFYLTTPLGIYPIHVVVFVASIFYVQWELFRAYFQSQGIRKKQVQYFLIATIIGYSGGITNYLINYDINLFPLYPFGNYTILLYVVIIGLSILRYRFLDIEVIIRKTLVFAGLFLMVMVITGTVTSVTQSYLGRFLDISPTISTILSVLIAILLYDPTRKSLVNLTDNYLFQRKFDYQKLLKDASEGISQIKSLHHLLRLVIHFITMRIRVKNAAVLLFDDKSKYFRFSYSRGYERLDLLKEGPTISTTHPLVDYLKVKHQAIDLERIKSQVEKQPKQKNYDFDFQAIKQTLDELKAVCVVPSFLSDRLLGILILGEKKSEEPYTEEDLNVLYTIAQESAIAIENARLYDEQIKRAKELEETNSQLNDAQTNLIRALKDAEIANEQLQITQASLIVAEKSATMVGMAKAIGHEVNNPLSVIIGWGGSMRKYTVSKLNAVVDRIAKSISTEDLNELRAITAKLDDNLARVAKSGNRIEVAVKTLTNLLKDTKGEMGPLSLIVLCREAIEATRFSTYEENLSGCEMKESIASNVIIEGNLEQLIQVFVNLIKNAYEAMKGQRNRKIEIIGNVDPDDQNMARIDFVDNGPGIPPDVMPKIWLQGFSTKIRKDDSIGAAGQGQGLFVVKHMIESIHKGSITAESEVGKGTTFIIRLPLSDQKDEING